MVEVQCPFLSFLASQDAQEVMYVSESVSQSVSESGTDRDFTDVTLVSDDTNYFTWFCDLDDPDDHDDHDDHDNDDHDDHDVDPDTDRLVI